MVAYSTKPTAANTSASPTTTTKAACESARRPVEPRAAGRTAARTGRRRTPSAAAPSRSRSSRSTAARRARRTARAAARPTRTCGCAVLRPLALAERVWTTNASDAGGDDQVERHEQVGRRAAGLDRDAERQRDHGQQRRAAAAAGGSAAASRATTASAAAAATAPAADGGGPRAAGASARCRPAAAPARARARRASPRARSARSPRQQRRRRRAARPTITPSLRQRSRQRGEHGHGAGSGYEDRPPAILYSRGACPLRSSRVALRLAAAGAVRAAAPAQAAWPGTPGIAANAPGTRGRSTIRAPRTSPASRRRQQLPVAASGATDLQIGTPPGGPTVHFTPTPGAAQERADRRPRRRAPR